MKTKLRKKIIQEIVGQKKKVFCLKNLTLSKETKQADCFNMNPEKIYKDETWKTDSERKRNKFEVSNYGRIKLNGKILKQIDSPDYGKGWLVLKDYPSLLVYKLVADAWLKYPKKGKGYHIHHIDNDGYNNKPDNLIYVTAKEHYKIHQY